MDSLIKFAEGKTYSTPSICDSECIFSITVERRTDKTIITTEGKRLHISVYNGREQVFPFGRYSMAAIIDASDLVESEPNSIPKSSDTLEELMEEGKETFTTEQLNSIKHSLAELLMTEAFTPEKKSSKIYYLADYRK